MHQRNYIFYLFFQKQTDALAREAQKNRKGFKQKNKQKTRRQLSTDVNAPAQ